jgi:predicted double-glycine peptidase
MTRTERMRRKMRALAPVPLLLALGFPAHATSLDTVVSGRVEVPLSSWRAQRDAGVVRQGFDYSCGAAALATLLSGSGDPIREREVLLAVFSGLSDEAAQHTMRQGLSLLDLKRVAEARGLAAEGYRVGPETLAQLTRPVLVRIEPYGYAHFAVLRGVRGDRVYLADPARGNVRMSLARFRTIWLGPDAKGVVFIVGTARSRLELTVEGRRPELMSARQLLAIGTREPGMRLHLPFP